MYEAVKFQSDVRRVIAKQDFFDFERLRDLVSSGGRGLSGSQEKAVDRLVDMYFSDEQEDETPGPIGRDILMFISEANKAAEKGLKILGKVPYLDEKDLRARLAEGIYEYQEYEEKDFWPLAVYISAHPKDKATIGLLLHRDGKKEMFEGNDEATPETWELVDEILGNKGKMVKVWGMHGDDLVREIQKTKVIPAGIFVSPKKSYAEGYWTLDKDKPRSLIETEIPLSAVNQNSEVDWVTRKDTKIDKLRIF